MRTADSGREKIQCGLPDVTKATRGQRMQFKTWVEEGIIKNVRKVDACMNKGRRWHPWGNVKAFLTLNPCRRI